MRSVVDDQVKWTTPEVFIEDPAQHDAIVLRRVPAQFDPCPYIVLNDRAWYHKVVRRIVDANILLEWKEQRPQHRAAALPNPEFEHSRYVQVTNCVEFILNEVPFLQEHQTVGFA